MSNGGCVLCTRPLRVGESQDRKEGENVGNGRQMGKKAREGRNWKEQRGWRMVSTPTRRLSVQLPRGSWDTGVVVGARWRHGCAKERSGRGWSWQSRPTHTSPSPSSVSPTSALSSIRRGSRSIYDRIHAALLISLVSRTEISLSRSVFDRPNTWLPRRDGEVRFAVVACCDSKRWPITGQMVGRD